MDVEGRARPSGEVERCGRDYTTVNNFDVIYYYYNSRLFEIKRNWF